MTDLRVGSGYDIHPRGDRGPLVLAGVRIDAAGLAGHSDADVVAHAVADALLGAVALGDLGGRFGTADEALAGADSMDLLAAVVADVDAAGFVPVNLDVTVLAESPSLAPHRDAMRTNLAAVLGLDAAAVSVKFTTTDRLGAIGRGEGMACTATCLVRRAP